MALSTTIGYSRAVNELKKRQREAAAALSSLTRYVISATATIESGFKLLRIYRYEQIGAAGESTVTITDNVGVVTPLYQSEEINILNSDQRYRNGVVVTITNSDTLVLVEKTY